MTQPLAESDMGSIPNIAKMAVFFLYDKSSWIYRPGIGSRWLYIFYKKAGKVQCSGDTQYFKPI